MRAARLVPLICLLLLAPLVATAPAMEAGPAAGPNGLRGFLLRPNEPVTHTFSRTPSFAWNPVAGAACYEFQLATSRTFDESTLVWSNVPTTARAGRFCGTVRFTTGVSTVGAGETKEETTVPIPAIRIPAVSINLTLPWFTGRPYALYAQVRAIRTSGPTAWSRPFGFNMRWENLAVPMQGRPGLVRWTPVEGATGYEVWFPGNLPGFPTGKKVRMHTNVADLREFYIFHLDDAWWRTVLWRVRAVREVEGALANGLPAVSYGPWSPVSASSNPGWSSGRIQLRAAVSDAVSTPGAPSTHQLMPALTFTGDQGLDGQPYRLFRFYATTDRDCVNVVFTGSVVGGPAFAPRTSGPLKLPTADVLEDATFGILPDNADESAKTVAADTTPIRATEAVTEDETFRVDLPDLDGRTTRYYWTVVPVAISFDDAGNTTYFDIESPQDACEAGRVVIAGKVSRPVITSGGTPYVSGLTPRGRLLTIAGKPPVVYSSPLVAWRPVMGARAYEIQWSRKTYPWRPRGTLTTFSTSAVLRLAPGLWHYRVRGLNTVQRGTSAMTWSAPVAVRVSAPTFRVRG